MSYTVRAYDENNVLVGQTSGTVTVVAPAPLRDAMQFVSETLRDDTVARIGCGSALMRRVLVDSDGIVTELGRRVRLASHDQRVATTKAPP